MRISDWSSDVCSSDLRLDEVIHAQAAPQGDFSGRRVGDAVFAGDQGDAEGDAAGGGQAAEPVCGGGGAIGGDRGADLRDRPGQARERDVKDEGESVGGDLGERGTLKKKTNETK